MDGSGSTSYCVTTGPAFQRVTRLGMLKLASLPSMIFALRAWSIPTFDARGAASSRSVIGGSRYSRRTAAARLPATGPGPPSATATRPGPVDAPSGKSVIRSPVMAVSYTHLRAHETDSYLVCRLL